MTAAEDYNDGGWMPHQFFPSIPHYWGDAARQCLIGAVALMLVSAPLYADSLKNEFPYEVAGALITIAFAALTNPLKRIFIATDAIIAGTGAVVYGTWALSGYGQSGDLAFVLRDAIAAIFLFAFYFSLKTLRAMILGEIGKEQSLDEFRSETDHRPEDDNTPNEDNGIY